MPIKALLAFGTRPEAIKMAPLVKALEKDERFECLVCVTGQHREMLDQALDIFKITPDYDLNVMRDDQSLASITTKVIDGLDDLFQKVAPDVIFVHGDTTTTVSAALAGFYNKIPVAHVEAGLRSNDIYSPYPEEMNRKLTSHIATYHFAPTLKNKENLHSENIVDNVYITGNTVIDSLRYTVQKNYTFKEDVLNKLDFNKKTILLTAHRRENRGEPLENICSSVCAIAEKYPDVQIVYPVHMSPQVKGVVHEHLSDITNVHLLNPLDVEDMHNLMARSSFILTDSGGLQEEAPSLGKPVLVLRKETERPEAIEAGTVQLATVNKDIIFGKTEELLINATTYEKMTRAVNPYGDGYAAEKIKDIILQKQCIHLHEEKS